MIKREIRFRAYDHKDKEMHYNIQDGIAFEDGSRYGFEKFLGKYKDSSDYHEWEVMQYTGHKTARDKELYEGDIVFVEESQEHGDERFYLVIVWVPEWSMFASLLLDEYHNFVSKGFEAIDEVLFWTYTLENAETNFHYAGNIYQHPELLIQEGV